MKEGDIGLTTIPQSDGIIKNRPVVLLKKMPAFNDFLVCGVSTQLHQEIKGFDEIVNYESSDFLISGLKAPSIIRLSFLAVIPARNILGAIGNVSFERYLRLINNLCSYLKNEQ